MRIHVCSLLSAFSLVGTSVLGLDIGSATMGITSGGLDSIVIAEGTASIPVEVYFSGTTGGLDGDNNGVATIYADLVGDAIAGVMQGAMTLDSLFTEAYRPLMGLYGLGFDEMPSGGYGGVGEILQFGAYQRLSGGPDIGDMAGAGTADAAHANGLPPVLMATGTLDLAALSEGSSYVVHAMGYVNLWDMGGGTIPASIVMDGVLSIQVAPEPSTVFLLAFGVLGAIGGRRR